MRIMAFLSVFVVSLLAVTAGILADAGANEGCGEGHICLSKGWTDEDREKWYWTTQGSRLFPEPWATALVDPTSDKRFWSQEHFSKYGYVWQNDFDPRPIGFPLDKDEARGFNWIGMNCSACHTLEIRHGGKKYLVDGAGALSDFQSMLRDLVVAMHQTRNDETRWKAFATEVLRTDEQSKVAELGRQVDKWLNLRRPLLRRNFTPVRYGYGRLDAVGHILNKVAHTLNPTQEGRPSDAPVSYPMIWNARQQKKLQWNGIIERDSVLFEDTDQELDVSGLGRNIGQVIGVFGELAMKDVKEGSRIKYSSIQARNLVKLERTLGKLHSPVWQDEFGKIDKNSTRYKLGKKLYDKTYNCDSCHTILASNDLKKKAEIVMEGIFDPLASTDPWMACNAVMHESDTGILEGGMVAYVSGNFLKEREPTTRLLTSLVARNIFNKSGELAKEVADSAVERAKQKLHNVWRSIKDTLGLGGPAQMAAAPGNALDQLYEKKAKDRVDCENLLRSNDKEVKALLAYKSRPLNGIWATAPYLHNGSVPNLRYLLAAPENRLLQFHVGSRQLDVNNVGFVLDHEPGERTSSFNVKFKSANGSLKTIPGNDNTGHLHGAGLCKGTKSPNGFTGESEECKAMLLYLKSL